MVGLREGRVTGRGGAEGMQRFGKEKKSGGVGGGVGGGGS